MVESVGKKLNQARLKRGLTLDEAAHATKLRPDKIAALESDDYTSFANNIYARGFLQIYARFLQVDVADFARTLDNANPISLSDYQYLNNAPAARRESAPIDRESRRPPSLAPLLFFVTIIILALLGGWIYTNYQRITGEQAVKAATHSMNAIELAPVSAAPAPAAEKLAAPVIAPPASTPSPAPAAATNESDHVATTSANGAASPAPNKTDPAKTSDQDFVTPSPVPTSDPTAHPVPPGGVNEVLVATVKKTWVTVRKDDPKAPPIFEDYVYPTANPLKLKGSRFFIEARDPAMVQITKNGLPFAYQAPNVPVE